MRINKTLWQFVHHRNIRTHKIYTIQTDENGETFDAFALCSASSMCYARKLKIAAPQIACKAVTNESISWEAFSN